MNLFPDISDEPAPAREPEPITPPAADNSPTLFAAEESASPMEEWRKRHGIMIYPTQEGFRACSQLRKAHGKTREESLLAWAERAGVPCWRNEALTKHSSDRNPKHPRHNGDSLQRRDGNPDLVCAFQRTRQTLADCPTAASGMESVTPAMERARSGTRLGSTESN